MFARTRNNTIVELINAPTDERAQRYFQSHERQVGDELVVLDYNSPAVGDTVVVDDDGVADLAVVP